jgi:hypothetical protein
MLIQGNTQAAFVKLNQAIEELYVAQAEGVNVDGLIALLEQIIASVQSS